ncbi:MAG TPA: hypothetical protein ENN53_06095 [Candidatus Acetothermia bacterium]|nr:hypothetical protein [Candidatus Acetothermia bacterium]
MKRAFLSTLVVALLGGGLAVGQGWCDPCPPPPPLEPPCYATFWAEEPILVKLVIPWGIFCCNPCATTTMITGWSVEAFGGGVVYSYVYPMPVAASAEIVWDQRDLAGVQVAPGFYRIVVATTGGDVATHVRIVARDHSCCYAWCLPASRACGVSLCDPYLKVSRAPTACPSCYDPCCDPCCFPWIFPFLFFLGK